MPHFGTTSTRRLRTVHPLLIALFSEVIKHYDCTVLCGHRNQAEQDEAFVNGNSELRWPESKHNKEPSLAIDVAPWPLVWPDKKTRPNEYVKDVGRFYMFVGYVLATAKQMSIPIRSGADWDRDWDLEDQNFDDLPHFELMI